MRILHTSDWHIGRGMAGHDLTDAQRAATAFIVKEAIDRSVDVVIIAGDVYDLQRPAVEDILHLREVMTQFHEAGIKLIITAGNHDSGPRLAANSNLLTEGVYISGLISEVGSGIELSDEHGSVVFYPLPYLEPNESRIVLADSAEEPLERSHQAVTAKALERVKIDLAKRPSDTRSVVIAHSFVIKAGTPSEEVEEERSDSERDLSIGGIQTVTSDIFQDIDYVALGHLHGPRDVGAPGKTTIRYSGSIIKYSLSEAKHSKSFVIVDLPAKPERCKVEIVEIPQLRGMHRFEDTLEAFLSNKYQNHRDDYVELLLTDEVTESDAYARLTQKFSRIIHWDYKKKTGGIAGSFESARTVQNASPIEVIAEFYRESTGKEPSADLQLVIQELYEKARDASDGAS